MPKAPAKKNQPTETRTVIYPETSVKEFRGDSAITVAQAKDWLGWTEAPDGNINGWDGKKARLTNNINNRPFREKDAKKYCQDILNREWRFNGETIIIGATGRIISGQHRLIALVWAGQWWADEVQGFHWKDKWEKEPTLESLVVFGAPEDEQTVRTIDNVAARSFTDVLTTDPRYFGRKSSSDRKRLISMLDNCVKTLWYRTGEDNDPYCPYMTHSNALDWLDRHPRVVKAISHVFEENQPVTNTDGKVIGSRIGDWIGPGTASALMYLAATGKSDKELYCNADPRSEKQLKFQLWDKAEEFIVALGTDTNLHKILRQIRRPTGEDEGEMAGCLFIDGEGKGSVAERTAVLARAWQCFLAGDKWKINMLTPEYTTTKEDDGSIASNYLSDPTTFGGIDRGDGEEEEAEDTTAEAPADGAAEAEKLQEDLDKQQKREEKKAKLLADRAAKKAAEGIATTVE